MNKKSRRDFLGTLSTLVPLGAFAYLLPRSAWAAPPAEAPAPADPLAFAIRDTLGPELAVARLGVRVAGARTQSNPNEGLKSATVSHAPTLTRTDPRAARETRYRDGR